MARTGRLIKRGEGWPPPEGGKGTGLLRWKDSEILVAIYDQTGLAGEQYRKLGIRIEALHETLSREMKIVLVTSPIGGDGKTATAANLAITLAKGEGRRVALVDCDTRNPRLHTLFETRVSGGLLRTLTGQGGIQDARERAEGVPLDLFTLPRGIGRRLDPMPIERMKALFKSLRESYDLVVCDAPPFLPVADTSALVRLADGVLVVVRAAKTPRQAVSMTLAGLDRNKLIGLVLNAVAEQEVASYYYPYADDDLEQRENGADEN
ncbi:MAG TPA: CpsD/CapB family tyrosine-protein kinase [Candidatus Saccharimonadales bacterium]|nr:CpsD/CapB family tyrosine-protein kinase [Candidatus Saccharimonadales bacterium]